MKEAEQILAVYGFSPVWLLQCLFNCFNKQLNICCTIYGLLPQWMFRFRIKKTVCENEEKHRSHLYCFFLLFILFPWLRNHCAAIAQFHIYMYMATRKQWRMLQNLFRTSSQTVCVLTSLPLGCLQGGHYDMKTSYATFLLLYRVVKEAPTIISLHDTSDFSVWV